MSEPLHRQTLADRVADLIEFRIREPNGWKYILPGYRTLARHFTTSNKTCEAALQILETRGVIKPASQGRRREVVDNLRNAPGNGPNPLSERRGTLLVISSSIAPTTEEDWYAIRQYGDCWLQQGGGVKLAQSDYGRFQNPASILSSLIETHQAGALLLHCAPRQWIEAAAELLPIYRMGGEGEGAPWAGDSYSLRREVTRILADLNNLGHKRVLIPVEPHLSGFRKQMLEAVEESNGGLPAGKVKDLCPVFSESVPAAWQNYWRLSFSTTSPTAVILLKDAHLLSLYSFCTVQGIRIPSDLSVICLGYSKLLEWCHPNPCQMRFPLQKAIVHFRKWIAGGLRPTGMKIFTLEKVSGESVACARKHPLLGNKIRGEVPLPHRQKSVEARPWPARVH